MMTDEKGKAKAKYKKVKKIIKFSDDETRKRDTSSTFGWLENAIDAISPLLRDGKQTKRNRALPFDGKYHAPKHEPKTIASRNQKHNTRGSEKPRLAITRKNPDTGEKHANSTTRRNRVGTNHLTGAHRATPPERIITFPISTPGTEPESPKARDR